MSITLVCTSTSSLDGPAGLVDDWASRLGTQFWRASLDVLVLGWWLAEVPVSEGTQARQLIEAVQSHPHVRLVTVHFMCAGDLVFVGMHRFACGTCSYDHTHCCS